MTSFYRSLVKHINGNHFDNSLIPLKEGMLIVWVFCFHLYDKSIFPLLFSHLIDCSWGWIKETRPSAIFRFSPKACVNPIKAFAAQPFIWRRLFFLHELAAVLSSADLSQPSNPLGFFLSSCITQKNLIQKVKGEKLVFCLNAER